MRIRGFITHKEAERYEDCQDFFKIDIDRKVLAISDGMSQSIFPQWWAEILAKAYINGWVPDSSDLGELRKEWKSKVIGFLEKQKQENKPTWMLENCLAERKGAGATLCGIRFSKCDYKGHVLGDSCLVCVGGHNEIEKIVRSQDGDFGNHPDYFDSIAGGKGTVKSINGILKERCKLLLVTDAIAEFLYSKRNESQMQDFISQLLQIKNHADFCNFIKGWRTTEGLHNDDSTLIIIENDGNDAFEVEYEDDLHELCRQEKEETVQEVEMQTTEALPKSDDKEDELLYLLDELKNICEKIRCYIDTIKKSNTRKSNLQFAKLRNINIKKLKAKVNDLFNLIK